MASDQHIHMVPLHGDLFIFQCKHPRSKGSEITFWRKSFNRDSGTFLNRGDDIVSVYEHASRVVGIVCCTTAMNLKMRQRVLCVLLKLKHRKGSQGFKYMLYCLSSRTSAKLEVEFSLPYEMSNNVLILRGPTLVWRHRDVVFYTSGEMGTVKEVPMRLKVSFLGELLLTQRPLAILGSQMTEEQVENDGLDKTILYFLNDGRTFSADCILPSAYTEVVRCMLFLSAKEVDGSLRSTVIAATCRKQLVWFENGLPEKVCLLPYEGPQSIQTVHAGSGCLIVIVFEHGNVCAVWKDAFQVAACWTDVRLLLVDDFIGAGFEQMLLLFQEMDSAIETLGKFLLTDLCGVCYSHGGVESDDVARCETAEENITLTIQALEARLQSGSTFLQDLQRDMCAKDHVIQQCVSALHALLSDRKHTTSSALQEGLVCLLDEQNVEDECTPHERMETSLDESPVNVERVWHRVIGHRLVFGALFTPTNQMTDYENMMAAVLATPPMIQSVNKIICYPEPLTSVSPGPPDAKRSKFPSGPAILIATDLTPLLTFDPVKCSVLLCFSTSQTAGASLHCKWIHFNLKGSLEGKFQPRLFEDCSTDSDDAREDLLSLMVAFETWSFHIESTDRTLFDVSRFLEERFQAKRIKINPQYLLSQSTQPPSAMLFHWKPCSSFDGILDVYCSDHIILLQFLDTVCKSLPVSHYIKLLRTGQGKNRSPTLFMEQEIRKIKEDVVCLLRGKAEEPSCDLISHITREQWLKERHDQLCPPEVKLYEHMVKRAIHLKIESDAAMLVEAELNKY